MARIKKKKRFGDRFDGALIRDIDAMHCLTAIIYPNRCDNEAYMSETVDLTALDEYLKKKNASEDEFKFTMFHCIVTALLKTITLRPKLNRFIQNNDFYQRDLITGSFIVKKQFSDHGAEGLAQVIGNPDDTLDSIHESLRKVIYAGRRKNSADDNSTEATMDILMKIPRGLRKWLVRRLVWLDRHGLVPYSVIAEDPYYCSFVISNVGSFGMKSGYHHLTNWGTCSLFCLVGKSEFRPQLNEDGSFEKKHMVDLGITIDERLADGYYYAKSIKMLRYFLEHPETLDLPLAQEVNIDGN